MGTHERKVQASRSGGWALTGWGAVEARAAALLGPGPHEPSAVEARTLLGLVDLTSLSGDEDEAAIRAVVAQGLRPGRGLPPVAGVCVEAKWAALLVRELAGSTTRAVVVDAGFPDGDGPLAPRIASIEAARAAGVAEVDVVLDWRACLAGEQARAGAALCALRAAAEGATLKVILETGALGSPRAVSEAASLALDCGADFLKTSTGKRAGGATLGAALVLLDALARAGRPLGLKVSGGVRTAAEAEAYARLAAARLGDASLVPARFRIGASALVAALATLAAQ